MPTLLPPAPPTIQTRIAEEFSLICADVAIARRLRAKKDTPASRADVDRQLTRVDELLDFYLLFQP